MNSFKSIINSSFTTWILMVFIVLALGFYLLIDDSILNFLFEGNPTKTKADLLTIYLGIIGGFGVFYGFYINNKKLEEQNKQNKIAEQNRNDKRFIDAINFLKDKTPEIVLTGINTLYQIAEQDVFYRQTVAVLFCKYLNRASSYCKDELVYDKVIEYLFYSNLFKDIKLEIENADVTFKIPIINPQYISSNNTIIFKSCKISNGHFKDIRSLRIQQCEMKCCYFYEVSYLYMLYTKCILSNIESVKIKVDNIRLEYCEFDILKINTLKGIDKLYLINNTGEININTPTISDKIIEGSTSNIIFNK